MSRERRDLVGVKWRRYGEEDGKRREKLNRIDIVA